jgi:hypothetical protein
MQNDTSKFLVNIIPLQNIQTNVGGTDDTTVLSNSVVAIQQMVNTDTNTIRTNYLQSFTSNTSINVISPLNLSNVAITSNDNPYTTTTTDLSVNSITTSSITVNGSGTFSGICYAQQFVTLSDMLRKNDVREWRSSVLPDMNKLHPYIFSYDTVAHDIGLMAQEVEAVWPQLVKEGVKGKYVNYDGMVAMLVKAVQELSARVSTLEGV